MTKASSSSPLFFPPTPPRLSLPVAPQDLRVQRVMVALPLTAGVGLCRLLGGSPSTHGDSSPGLHMPRVAHLADTASTGASQTQSRTVLLADSPTTAISPVGVKRSRAFPGRPQIHMMQARDERDQVEAARAAGVVGVEPGL